MQAARSRGGQHHGERVRVSMGLEAVKADGLDAATIADWLSSGDVQEWDPTGLCTLAELDVQTLDLPDAQEWNAADWPA